MQKNAGIMRSIIREIKRVNCEGILLIVSNPVDILTQVALEESGFPKERVIGSGTVLGHGAAEISGQRKAGCGQP